MKFGLALAIIGLLCVIQSSLQTVVAADCQWAQGTYDFKKYVRVIRRGGGQYPITFLCWERSKIVGNIFTNIESCLLAVSDEDGINCNLCENGFIVRLGKCVKMEPGSSS